MQGCQASITALLVWQGLTQAGGAQGAVHACLRASSNGCASAGASGGSTSLLGVLRRLLPSWRCLMCQACRHVNKQPWACMCRVISWHNCTAVPEIC